MQEIWCGQRASMISRRSADIQCYHRLLLMNHFTGMATCAYARSPSQMPRENPHHIALESRRLVVEVRGQPFDGLAQRRELGLASAAFGALHARELVHRRVADLAMHDVAVIRHGEAESQTFEVVPDDLVARERHPIVPFPPNGTMQKIRRLVTMAARRAAVP